MTWHRLEDRVLQQWQNRRGDDLLLLIAFAGFAAFVDPVMADIGHRVRIRCTGPILGTRNCG